MTLYYCLYALAAWFMGSVPYSYIAPKLLRGVDVIAQSNDKNPGTANAMEFGGIATGFLCLFLDLAKGFAPVFIAFRIFMHSDLLFAIIIVAPVLGHAFSPWLWKRTHGGKAIAVSFGVLLGAYPYYRTVFLLVALYLLFSLFIIINPHKLRSIVTYTLFGCLSPIFSFTPSIFIACMAISAIVILKHLQSPHEAPVKISLLKKIPIIEIEQGI